MGPPSLCRASSPRSPPPLPARAPAPRCPCPRSSPLPAAPAPAHPHGSARACAAERRPSPHRVGAPPPLAALRARFSGAKIQPPAIITQAPHQLNVHITIKSAITPSTIHTQE
ncbi:MAG: hypothetical protein AMXMBFR56_75990 [Polyangiaceae bacterium]